jgi:hypothetical protein
VTAAGMLDAASAGSWELVVVLAIIAVLQLVVVANLSRRAGRTDWRDWPGNAR